jgi:hypothetical protein
LLRLLGVISISNHAKILQVGEIGNTQRKNWLIIADLNIFLELDMRRIQTTWRHCKTKVKCCPHLNNSLDFNPL